MSEGNELHDQLRHENEKLRSRVATLEDEVRRCRTTLYSIGDAVIATDIAGTIIQMNHLAETLTGWRESEALGQPLTRVFRVINEDTRAEIASPAERVLREGITVGLANHTLLIARDGTERPIADSGAPIRDEHGATIGVVLVFRDQAEERAVQKALQEQEETFRALAENANDGIFITIGAGVQAYANKRAAEITGYSVAELLGTSIRDLTPPDEAEKILERYAKRIAGERILSQYETVMIHKNATSIPIEVTAAKTVWRGQPADLAIVRDISERRRAEQKLRESEQLLHTQFANSPDLILIIDRHMKIITINRVIAGPDTVEQLIGRNAVDILPTDQDMVRRRITECFVSGQKQEFEHEIGDGVWVHARLVPLPSADVVERVMIISSDISEHKRAEKERLNLQEQLFQAQKMESIGTLAGGVAHDFNNILAAIMAGLSLLEFDFEEVHESHREIIELKALVQRGADLTKQLLGFARLGKYDAKPLDLNEVVTKLSTMFGRARKDIIIHLECATDLLPVLADRTQIEQVLLSLLVNAGQAMPNGGEVMLRTENVELTATDNARNGTKPGRYVQLSVADTGVGMDAKTRERIFEPFFTTKKNGVGSGLGLASAYGIVKNHSGFVTVESEPGKGATFFVYLPATEQCFAEKKKPTPRFPKRHDIKSILLVDDEEQIISCTARLLSAVGYDVLTAQSGPEAIEIFRQNQERISLIILDMIMPGMNGSQTFDALRAIAPSVKVLLSSGYSIEGEATTILKRGCSGFIQKPFDLATLSKKIEEIFSGGTMQ